MSVTFSSNSMVGFRNVVFSQINICHVTTAYVMDMLKRCLFSYTLTAVNYKVTFFSGVGSVVFKFNLKITKNNQATDLYFI